MDAGTFFSSRASRMADAVGDDPSSAASGTFGRLPAGPGPLTGPSPDKRGLPGELCGARSPGRAIPDNRGLPGELCGARSPDRAIPDNRGLPGELCGARSPGRAILPNNRVFSGEYLVGAMIHRPSPPKYRTSGKTPYRNCAPGNPAFPQIYDLRPGPGNKFIINGNRSMLPLPFLDMR